MKEKEHIVQDTNLSFINSSKNIKSEGKESDILFRNVFALLNNTPFAVIFIRHDKKINYVSPQFSEIYGYALEDIPDADSMLAKFLFPENKKTEKLTEFIFNKGGKNKQFSAGTFYINAKNKTQRKTKFTAVDTAFNNKFIFFEDITDRSNYEETIKESEEKFRSIVENSHAGIIIVGSDYLFSYVNDQFCKIIGYSQKELIGKDFRNYLAKSSKEIVAERYKKRQKGEHVPSEYTFQIITKGGGVKTVQISSAIAKEKNGNVVTIAQILDINDRVEAEKKVIESEQRYRTLFETAGDSIFIMKNELFVDCNERTLELFNCRREQIIGKTPYRFSPAKQYDGTNSKKKAISILKEAYSGKHQHFEWHHKKLTGELFDAEVSLTVFESGGEKFIQAIVRDVSERKAAEIALEKRSKIEKMISEISSAFINIPIEKIDNNIVLALKKIVKLTASSEGVLFVFSEDQKEMKMTHRWGKTDNQKFFKDFTLELKDLKWWSSQILNQKTVSISDINDLPPTAEFEKNIFRKVGIFSILDIPLIYRENVIGILGLNSRKGKLEFNADEISLLNVLGQIFVNALQRKKTELNLRESEERLELALKGADLGLWDWEVQTGKVTFNENWARILGYKLSDIKPRFETWQNLVHNEDYQRVRKSLNDHLKGKSQFYEAEYRIKTKSGKWKWILDKGKVFERDKKGKALRAAGTTLDITDKKNVEAALIQSEERFRGLFENSAFGIFQTSLDGKIELCNNSFLEIFGYQSIDEIKDKDVSKSFYASSVERENFLTELFLKGKIAGREVEYKNAKGKKVFVREYARIVNVNGRNIIEGAVENITKNKLAEFELVKAKEKAEESDKLKSEFLAQMSHEIRTPINTVLSFAGLLKEELSGKLVSDLEESFGIMNRAGKRIIRTIDLLLDMSQMQTGTYEINLQKIDLCDKVLKEIADEYYYTAREKKLKFEIIKKNDDNFIIGDEYTVGQILHNLIDNAIKYTDQGSIQVIIGKEKNKEVYIKVADTGIGISEEYLPNLFKPFTQEDQGYTRKYEGNGLGLALVQSYCSINNAKISVTSKKGKGTVFTVRFNSK